MRLRWLTLGTAMRVGNKSRTASATVQAPQSEHVQLCYCNSLPLDVKVAEAFSQSACLPCSMQSSTTYIVRAFCAIQMSLPIKFSI